MLAAFYTRPTSPGLPIHTGVDCFTRWRANCLQSAAEGNKETERARARARVRARICIREIAARFAYEGNVYDIRIMRAWVFLLRRTARPCMDKRCPIRAMDLPVTLFLPLLSALHGCYLPCFCRSLFLLSFFFLAFYDHFYLVLFLPSCSFLSSLSD